MTLLVVLPAVSTLASTGHKLAAAVTLTFACRLVPGARMASKTPPRIAGLAVTVA